MFANARERRSPAGIFLKRAAATAAFPAILLAAAMAVMAAASAADAADAAASASPLTFSLKYRALCPGEAIALEARSRTRLQSLEVEAFHRVFPAFSVDDGHAWTALIGIDLQTRPGRYRLVATGTDRQGKRSSASVAIRVLAKKFPARRLAVDEKFVTPPDEALERIEKERALVQNIFADASPERFWRGSFLKPVPGQVISAFGKRNFYNGKARDPHAGVDYQGAEGTPIAAPGGGKVVLARDLYYAGNTVILDHGLGLYSYLAHMSEFSVKEGDAVAAGDIIGRIGATGRVTGPHLHWTVRLAGARIDPVSLIWLLMRSSRGL